MPRETNDVNRVESSGDALIFQTESAYEFPIVGIGASAGGLAAFELLFTSLPPDTGMAFVVIQHLSPPHKSILPEILQRWTAMPVAQVAKHVEVKPNSVYVIPPGHDLILKEGHLELLKPEAARGYHLPIDLFFRTLAQDQGGRAIGVVLSGTGSDGTQGLKNIKAEGGLTIAQEPDSAEYGDMPRNAIATKDVDFILPPEKIGELILKYIHHKVLEEYKRSDNDFDIPEGGMQKLYYLLRSKTGHDFSLYKQNTLMRRIERRMKISLVNNLDEYIGRLEEHPEEIEALFQEMLINVTQFFREPEAFQALIEKAIRPLIALKQAAQAPIRAWVAGCSSGEEAYSVAIAIQEQIDALKWDGKVQIYATDLDAEAITAARRGFYSGGSLENVSTERLQRFFHPEEEGYQIQKAIREMVVFSTQNLISDPPFSRIDLLCCRNVLIYLEHELQNQLFFQFHYSLNPGGMLFLGNSESIGGNSELFAVVDRKHKLFQRKEAVTQHTARTKSRLLPQKVVLSPRGDTGAGSGRPIPGMLRALTEKALLEDHTPACVIIDPKHNILFIHGRTGKYLEPVAGETNADLLRMAREGLKAELATAIHAVIAHHEPVRREGIRVKTNGDYQAINLTVQRVEAPPDVGDLIMVVFEEAQTIPAETSQKTTHAEPKNHEIRQLQKELKEKDEYLHTIIDELEDSNQDLKSSNEELQSANEEMQSTNEELETSKEELQSINEELSTINAELSNKNEELSEVNNDIYNLLSSIEIGMIFLDLELKIRRFTPTINRVYHFLPADIGRPIEHFVSNLSYDHLLEDINQVLNTLVPLAIEVQAKDGVWYLINIKPYRTLANVIDGTVITFVDISRQKQGDELRRMGTILRDSNDAVTVQDFNGKILAWNRGAAQMYGWSEAEALRMNSLDLIAENNRAEAAAIYQRLSEGENLRSFETQRVTRDGRTLDVWMTLTALVDDANLPVGIATTERDITGRNQISRHLSFENRALKALNQWHQTLLERPEHPSLAQEACRMLVEKAGYRMAWIGRVGQDETKTIIPITWAGLEGGEPEALPKTGRKVVERVLKSGRPVAVRNILTNPSQDDGRADALKYHYGSFLALPLRYENDPPGILLIYAREAEAFVDPEIDWLLRLSEGIVQAIGPEWKKLERQKDD